MTSSWTAYALEGLAYIVDEFEHVEYLPKSFSNDYLLFHYCLRSRKCKHSIRKSWFGVRKHTDSQGDFNFPVGIYKNAISIMKFTVSHALPKPEGGDSVNDPSAQANSCQ